MLSSDHSPTMPELKLLNEGNFLKAWGGISSLQVSVAMSVNLCNLMTSLGLLHVLKFILSSNIVLCGACIVFSHCMYVIVKL